MTVTLAFLPAVACLVFLARAAGTRRAWLTQIPLALAFGVGISSVVWLMMLVAVPPARWLACDIALWSIALVLAFLVEPGRPGEPVNDAARTHAALKWLAIAGFLFTAGLAITGFASVSRVLPHAGWDAWSIWNMRARFLFRGQPELWKDAFSEPLAFSQPGYPLLVPLSVVRGWTFEGEETVIAPVLISALFSAAVVAAAALSVARRRTATHGLLTATAILACPAFLKWAPSQLADLPLSCFIVGAFVMLSRALEPDGRPLWWILAGVSAGLAAWTKNEGLPFLLVFLTVCTGWLFLARGRAGLPFAGRLVAGATVGVAALLLFKWQLAPTNYMVSVFSPARALALATDLDRLRIVGTAFGRELWFGGATMIGVLPIVLVYVGVAGVRRDAAATLALVSMAGLLGCDAIVYAITPYDLVWHINTSLERVIVQVFPTSVWGLMMLSR